MVRSTAQRIGVEAQFDPRDRIPGRPPSEFDRVISAVHAEFISERKAMFNILTQKDVEDAVDSL